VIVLDTNVLSELMRPAPSRRVVAWLDLLPGPSLFTTCVTQAEIWYGVFVLPAGRRRTAIEAVVSTLFDQDFVGRILAFDSDAALLFARIAADRRRTGRPISQSDAEIAAIARSRGATLATRNTSDFEGCGIRLIDPWRA
jgi:predicted nucleic acid-binding protein